MSKWYIEQGNESDVAISTRVRLARNLCEYPFPARLDIDKKNELNQKVRDIINEEKKELKYIEMNSLNIAQAVSLAERHLISPEFASSLQGRALVLSENEDISIMLNEEDHIRIQAMTPGLDLEKAYEKTDEIDTLLNKNLNFAFDERIGYLTQCPTNIGTGMRASVMLHLPALTQIGMISRLSSTISKLGLTIRGAFGEGTAPKGDIYQLSNQVTLGISEKEAIFNLNSICKQLISQERNSRKELLKDDEFVDKIYRAYGILKYARKMNGSEFMELMSLVRLGAAENILSVEKEKINMLIVNMQPATIKAMRNEELSADERDVIRAEEIRKTLE